MSSQRDPHVMLFRHPTLAGEQDPLQTARAALQQQAERILPFTDGAFSPSPPPAALEKLTDEL